MKIIFTMFVLFHLSLNFCFAKDSGKVSCLKRALANLIGKTAKPTSYLQDEVDLIWYPKAGYVAISHYEIRVKDVIYDALMGVKEKAKFEAAYRAAKSGKGKGFFRFKLAVTPDELTRIESFVKNPENAKGFQTCVGGVCKVIKKNTDIKIPFPFSQVPTLNSAYLTIMQKMGYKRILKVEYVGQNAWKNLISTEIPYELWVSYQLGTAIAGLIVWAVNEVGEVVRLVIPISESENKE